MTRKKHKTNEGEWSSTFVGESKVSAELKKLTSSPGWVAATHKLVHSAKKSPESSRASTPVSNASSSSRHSDTKILKNGSKGLGRPPSKQKFRMVLEKDEDYEVDYVSPDEETTADESDVDSKADNSDPLSEDNNFSLDDDDDASSLGDISAPMVDQYSDVEPDDDFPPLNLPESSMDLVVPNHLLMSALGIYEIFRHFRNSLRISPMLFEDFCAALIDKDTNILLTECYISVLKALLREDDAAGVLFGPPDQNEQVRVALNFLDHMTWPEVIRSYLESYLTEHADAVKIVRDAKFPSVGVEDKITVLKTLTDIYLASNKIRDQLMTDGVIHYDDHCRACHKLGDLLCCETCPAVYHLACCDPPLEEVPDDEWQCEVCAAHKLNGVYNCEPQHEFRGQYLRHEPIGTDRHGNKYWFLARRLIIEGQDKVWYYSTQEQFENVLSMLDQDRYEMVLFEALKDVAEEFPKYSKITRDLTEEALPDERTKPYLDILTIRVKKEIEEKKAKKREEEEKRKKEEEKKTKEEAEQMEVDKETTNQTNGIGTAALPPTATTSTDGLVAPVLPSPGYQIPEIKEASDEMSSDTTIINHVTTTPTVSNIKTETPVPAKVALAPVKVAVPQPATAFTVKPPETPVTGNVATTPVKVAVAQPAIDSAAKLPGIPVGARVAVASAAVTPVGERVAVASPAVASVAKPSGTPVAVSVAPTVIGGTATLKATTQNATTTPNVTTTPKPTPVPQKNFQVIKLGQGLQVKTTPKVIAPSIGGLSQLKTLFVLNKDGTRTQITLGPAGKILTPTNKSNPQANRQILVLNSAKVPIPKVNRELKKLQFAGAGPKTFDAITGRSVDSHQVPSTSAVKNTSQTVQTRPKIVTSTLMRPVKEEDPEPPKDVKPLTHEEEAERYFRLGEDKAYKQYVNHYSENLLALNKYQHREERDRERHLGYKFSMTGEGEFKWMGSVLGNEETVIDTLRSTLMHFEHQIPLCFMHTRWGKYRKAWGKIVMKCNTPQGFAAALGILEMATRAVVKKSVWKDSHGLTRLQRVTASEKEEFDKRRKQRTRADEEEGNRKGVWCKYPIPMKSTMVWKMRGEEYRMTGYGGWIWLSNTRHAQYKPYKPKPFTLVHKVDEDAEKSKSSSESKPGAPNNSTEKRDLAAVIDMDTDSEKSSSTTSTTTTKSADFIEDRGVFESLVQEVSTSGSDAVVMSPSKDFVKSQTTTVPSDTNNTPSKLEAMNAEDAQSSKDIVTSSAADTVTSQTSTNSEMITKSEPMDIDATSQSAKSDLTNTCQRIIDSSDVINVSENLLKRTPLYNKKWAASKVDVLLGWRIMQRDTDKQKDANKPKTDASDTAGKQAGPVNKTTQIAMATTQSQPAKAPAAISSQKNDVTTTTDVNKPTDVTMATTTSGPTPVSQAPKASTPPISNKDSDEVDTETVNSAQTTELTESGSVLQAATVVSVGQEVQKTVTAITDNGTGGAVGDDGVTTEKDVGPTVRDAVPPAKTVKAPAEASLADTQSKPTSTEEKAGTEEPVVMETEAIAMVNHAPDVLPQSTHATSPGAPVKKDVQPTLTTADATGTDTVLPMKSESNTDATSSSAARQICENDASTPGDVEETDPLISTPAVAVDANTTNDAGMPDEVKKSDSFISTPAVTVDTNTINDSGTPDNVETIDPTISTPAVTADLSTANDSGKLCDRKMAAGEISAHTIMDSGISSTVTKGDATGGVSTSLMETAPVSEPSEDTNQQSSATADSKTSLTTDFADDATHDTLSDATSIPVIPFIPEATSQHSDLKEELKPDLQGGTDATQHEQVNAATTTSEILGIPASTTQRSDSIEEVKSDLHGGTDATRHEPLNDATTTPEIPTVPASTTQQPDSKEEVEADGTDVTQHEPLNDATTSPKTAIPEGPSEHEAVAVTRHHSSANATTNHSDVDTPMVTEEKVEAAGQCEDAGATWHDTSNDSTTIPTETNEPMETDGANKVTSIFSETVANETVDTVTDTTRITSTSPDQTVTMVETVTTTITKTTTVNKTVVSAGVDVETISGTKQPAGSTGSILTKPQGTAAATGGGTTFKSVITADRKSGGGRSMVTTIETSRSRQSRMSRVRRVVHQTPDGTTTSTTAATWKLQRYRKTSATVKKEKAMKLPLPWKYCADKKRKKSVFRLPPVIVRKLALIGGLRPYYAGFHYGAKWFSGLEQFWMYPCPRPLFYLVWRYKLQNVCTLASVAHLLRVFWHAIRWDKMTLRPQTDDVVHTVTTDDEIITTELLKRKDDPISGLHSEYYVRRITMPILDPEGEALRAIKPADNYTPSRRGLRSSTRPFSLRDRSRKEGPQVEMVWVPEEKVEMWQIRLFDTMAKQQRQDQLKGASATSAQTSSPQTTLISSPAAGFLSTLQKTKTTGMNMMKIPMQQAPQLVTSLQGKAQTSHTFQTFLDKKPYNVMVTGKPQVQKIIVQPPGQNQQFPAYRAGSDLQAPIIRSTASGTHYIVQGGKLIKPIIIKAASQITNTPIQQKPVHPTIKLNDGTSPVIKFQQQPPILPTLKTPTGPRISPRSPNQTQIKLSSSQLSQLMKVGVGTPVRVSVSLGNGRAGIGQIQLIPPGSQVTPSTGQQLMQTRVGGELKRFLFTLISETMSSPGPQSPSNEVSLQTASLSQRLQQMQKHSQSMYKRHNTDMKKLLTDKDPLWGSRPQTPERTNIFRRDSDRSKKKPLNREEREEGQRHNVAMQVMKSILDRIERREDIEMRKRKREEALLRQRERKEQTEQAKVHNHQTHLLQRHRDKLKQEILRRRAVVEKYLTHSAKNELREDQKRRRPSADSAPLSKRPKKTFGNAIVTSAVLTENNAKRPTQNKNQTQQPITTKRRRTASPPPDNKKQKMINTQTKKSKDKNLYCICKTPYDPSKFYIGCDLCLNWFHGSCVGIPEAKAKHMNEWVCDDCKKVQEDPSQELYCLCRTPYDDSKFYIGCDICQDWYHGGCVGVSEKESESIDFYTCPRCSKKNKRGKDAAVDENKLTRDDFVSLTKIVRSLRAHKMAWPFLQPVSKLEVPNYHRVIKKPMDLGTIMQKLNSYTMLSELVGDVSLIFDNCRMFNGADSALAKCAEIVESVFVGKIREFRSKRGRK